MTVTIEDEARARRQRRTLPVVPDAAGELPLSPTDVAQFIRLEQCQRYLRLRLHERAVNRNFLREYGVVPQSIPPLLTRSGAAFEARVEVAVRARFAAHNFATDTARGKGWATRWSSSRRGSRWRWRGGGCAAMSISCAWRATRTAPCGSSSPT